MEKNMKNKRYVKTQIGTLENGDPIYSLRDTYSYVPTVLKILSRKFY